MNKKEFMAALDKLQEDSKSANLLDTIEIVQATKDLFEQNYSVAYEIGAEESMSYKRNPAQAIFDRMHEKIYSLNSDNWLPSSWERC